MTNSVFQLSLDAHYIPKAWKTSHIVPVAKVANPAAFIECRPVALTSIVMKSLERIVLKHILKDIHCDTDPLQFAYRNETSTEDTLVYMI